jgi:zinc transport system ATP-binding protein
MNSEQATPQATGPGTGQTPGQAAGAAPETAPEPAVEITGLDFAYNGAQALSGVNLRLPHGDFLAILGPNGGGKTTLLKLILGLLAPTAGSVRVYGRPAGASGGLAGYLPQHTHVSPSFPITVLDAVLLGLSRPGLLGASGLKSSAPDKERAREALRSVGMLDLAERRVSGLSGGQKQRVLLARALVSGPRLLLLDEPTASIDHEGKLCIHELLAKLNEDMTIVMVSHDLSVIGSSVKSVACVNRTLHHHAGPQLTEEMFRAMYGHGSHACPVELLTHGRIPHRVLDLHQAGTRACGCPDHAHE